MRISEICMSSDTTIMMITSWLLLNPLVPQMEIQLAITKKKMETAAEEERFTDAAMFRDRLEVLRLEQR